MVNTPTETFDLVIRNGRVIDPSTSTDTIADIGIKNGSICALALPGTILEGKEAIDADGLVVAPGFIDIHTHEDLEMLPRNHETSPGDLRIAPSPPHYTMNAFLLDGVTTMIGGNCGISFYPLAGYFNLLEQEGCLINYASYGGHNTYRGLAGAGDRQLPATAEQVKSMAELAQQDLDGGALGISYGIMYAPGTSYAEMLAMARVAAARGGLAASHARCGWDGPEALDSMNEMISIARDSGITMQYSHIGSMAGYGEYMDACLAAMSKAQSEGIRVFADVYPYGAWMTNLGSAILDDGFFERNNCEPADLESSGDIQVDGKMIMKRGERYTQESFYRIRALTMDGKIPDPFVIGHVIKQDKIQSAMLNPFVMIGSDGGAVVDTKTGKLFGHPRTAGTRARFLGEFVRQGKLMDLVTAIYKCSTLPAEVLGLKKKGGLFVGADADITIFDADRITDTAKFGTGFLSPPEGIAYVLVNGVPLVDKGKIVPGIRPGKVIRRQA